LSFEVIQVLGNFLEKTPIAVFSWDLPDVPESSLTGLEHCEAAASPPADLFGGFG